MFFLLAYPNWRHVMNDRFKFIQSSVILSKKPSIADLNRRILWFNAGEIHSQNIDDVCDLNNCLKVEAADINLRRRRRTRRKPVYHG
jgi:hypothetical protein